VTKTPYFINASSARLNAMFKVSLEGDVRFETAAKEITSQTASSHERALSM
jgi:hypothetical protein